MTHLTELATRALATMTPFTPLEHRLLEATGAGRAAGDAARPMGPGGGDPERTVRSDLLHWLCTDAEAQALVGPDGVRLRGAYVPELVDLRWARVDFPLAFARCVLPAGLDLGDAEVARLTLSDCDTGPVRCDRLTVHGTVVIADGTRVLGGVRLSAAGILGDLVLSGARLVNRGAVALAGVGLQVEGDLCLDRGFRALGTVRLNDAAVAGRLDLRGGRFLNRGAVALACDRIHVGGATHLTGNFRAYGQVRFRDARFMGPGRIELRQAEAAHADPGTGGPDAREPRALEAGREAPVTPPSSARS